MENYEEALERFFIMTAEPDVDDITALKYISQKYGRPVALKIWEEWFKK